MMKKNSWSKEKVFKEIQTRNITNKKR